MAKRLHLKFDANQDYQLAAVASVTDLFDGMANFAPQFALQSSNTDEIVANLPQDEILYPSTILENLQHIQQRNGFKETGHELEQDSGIMLEGVSNDYHEFPSFTVEMETGTGKTYVYLRTIYELRRQYGFSKFIIVVPSIAIFEGVIKAEEMTRDHFRSIYHNETINLTGYDGGKLSRIRSFASASTAQAQVLVMTLDAFNKATNIIYRQSEKLPGELKPYEYIQQTRPILILDEPQSIDTTEKARQAIRTLRPLFALRYSATHRISPNLVYRLTPVEAYRRNLVKKIQVIGVTSQDNMNVPFLALESVSRDPFRAKVKTYLTDQGQTREEIITLKQGDNLHKFTKRDEHRDGYIVAEISVAEGRECMVFENGLRLERDEAIAASRPEVFRTQIAQTIENHFTNQGWLIGRGVKVLSLFFIDRVNNYTAENGLVKRIFDEEFNRLKKLWPHLSQLEPEKVRAAYFAKKRSKDNTEEAVDTEGKTEEQRKLERAAFNLIMRDKERLLSFDESACFIFAHSALREGWDNPNVFQICTLKQTVSTVSRRQEIGRGLRLAVNQDGERVHDDDVNILTVISDESYNAFAEGLQREYEADGEEAPPKPKRAQESEARRNNAIFKSADFREFWQKLNRKTTYRINIDTPILIDECVRALKETPFPNPLIVLTKGRFSLDEFTIRLQSVNNKLKTARLYIEIKEGDGRIKKEDNLPVQERTDLKAVLKDDRLRGYRVLEMGGEGDEIFVKFTNGQEVRRWREISFTTKYSQRAMSQAVREVTETYPVFDFIGRAAKETKLTRATLLETFKRLPDGLKRRVFKNPEGFANVFIGTIKHALANHVAERVEFDLAPDVVPHETDEIFPEVKKFPQKELVEAGKRGLYNKVQWDSDVELSFIEKKLRMDEEDLVFYFKFPPKFKLDFPRVIGDYNPDWGIVRFNGDGAAKLHLVRETKGTTKLDALQFPSEVRKIKCAEKLFALLNIDYKVIDGTEANWWNGFNGSSKKLY